MQPFNVGCHLAKFTQICWLGYTLLHASSYAHVAEKVTEPYILNLQIKWLRTTAVLKSALKMNSM